VRPVEKMLVVPEESLLYTNTMRSGGKYWTSYNIISLLLSPSLHYPPSAYLWVEHSNLCVIPIQDVTEVDVHDELAREVEGRCARGELVDAIGKYDRACEGWVQL